MLGADFRVLTSRVLTSRVGRLSNRRFFVMFEAMRSFLDHFLIVFLIILATFWLIGRLDIIGGRCKSSVSDVDMPLVLNGPMPSLVAVRDNRIANVTLIHNA